TIDALPAAVEDHVDVGVPRRPGILETGGALLGEGRVDLAAQPVEGLPQRAAPRLAPAGMGAGVAAAVLPPALDTVGAAPGAVLEDLRHVTGRMALEVLAVVGEPGRALRLEAAQDVGEPHVPEAMVVAVGFAVGRDVNELGPAALVRKRPFEPHQERLAAAQQLLEGHRP